MKTLFADNCNANIFVFVLHRGTILHTIIIALYKCIVMDKGFVMYNGITFYKGILLHKGIVMKLHGNALTYCNLKVL